MCAISRGRSLDTTMGLTPVSGLPGATRCGVIDPSLIFHYTNRAGRISHDRSLAVNVHVTEAEEILNKRSGWNALTGTTDFGEIVRHMTDVDARRARGEAVKEDEGKWREHSLPGTGVSSRLHCCTISTNMATSASVDLPRPPLGR